MSPPLVHKKKNARNDLKVIFSEYFTIKFFLKLFIDFIHIVNIHSNFSKLLVKHIKIFMVFLSLLKINKQKVMNSIKLLKIIIGLISILAVVSGNLITLDGQCPFSQLKPASTAIVPLVSKFSY